MIDSKEWNWEKADKQQWLIPSEDGLYLADKWAHEKAHSILDLGCGLGRHSVLFAKRGFKVTAVDLSQEAISFAKKWSKQENVDILCKAADMKTLPFYSDAFDRVFSYHVISHTDTEGVRQIIDEITRVLKPWGKVFLTLCSKTHYAFSQNDFPHIDKNTALKTEGAEVEVPHFFADMDIIKDLFRDYSLDKIRHIEDYDIKDNYKQRSHYFIEASIRKGTGQIHYGM